MKCYAYNTEQECPDCINDGHGYFWPCPRMEEPETAKTPSWSDWMISKGYMEPSGRLKNEAFDRRLSE